MLGHHADAPPLVDHEHAERREGVIDVAVDQLELEAGRASFGQQGLCLRAGFLGIAAVTGQRRQLVVGKREGRARQQRPADGLEDGDLGQGVRSAPAVDGHRQRLPDLEIVEGLGLRIEQEVDLAHPRRLLHRDLILERIDQLRTFARRDGAELGLNLSTLQRRHHRLRLDEDRAETIEVGFAFLPVPIEALAHPVRSIAVLDEHEGAAAHHGLGGEIRVLG